MGCRVAGRRICCQDFFDTHAKTSPSPSPTYYPTPLPNSPTPGAVTIIVADKDSLRNSKVDVV